MIGGIAVGIRIVLVPGPPRQERFKLLGAGCL